MRKFLFISVMLLSASTALAGHKVGHTDSSTKDLSVKLPNPLGVKSIEDLIEKAGPFLAGLAATVAGLMIVVGAFMILTAAGDPAKFEKGKKTILYAVIGLAVVLLSSLIVNILKELVKI